MQEPKPHAANAPGDFYVEDDCCTMCMVPFEQAPELFGECQDPKGYRHCFVKRQPETDGELTKMMGAIRHAEFMCIRYKGGDKRIQLRLIEVGEGAVCDDLPSDLRQQVEKELTKSQRVLMEMRAQRFRVAVSKRSWWRFWRRR